MPISNLSDRQKKLLCAVIEEYIEEAKPIGSQNLVAKCKLEVSPATVRNEMVRLLEEGLLDKPHSSSGRVPTTMGIRLYLSDLMREEELPVIEEVSLKQRLWPQRFSEIGLWYEGAMALADSAKNLAVVLAGDYISRLNSIEAKIVDLGDVESDKIKFDRVLELLTSLGHEKDHTYANIEIHNERKKNAIKSILLVDEKIKQYYLKEKDILSNQKVNSDIDNNQTELDSKKLEFSGLSNLIQDKYSEVVVLDSKIEQILSDIEHIKSLEEEFEAYEYYLDAVKRDGIPYELIKKSLPTIEGAVNEILAQMVDFNIIIHMDGKNINTFIVYDDDNMWPLELSSGMERFVASLAIRVGLINVCNLPRNNALYLDEGFGSLDADNLNTIHMMFDYLKNTFPFIILVSHLENMRDIVDTQLEINKIGEYSEINYQ